MSITIAITGSSGFVGKHLVAALLARDFQVLELDYNKGYDLVNENAVNLIPKFDIIVHLASLSFVPKSFEQPYKYYHNNYLITLNVLELAKRYDAKVIYFSSYLYGTPIYLPIDELHPTQAHNPYAQTKLICELLCGGYNRDFQIPILVFRPFNIYGFGQDSNFLIPTIIGQIHSGKITLNDPRPKRDYIYIDDVIDAIIKGISWDFSSLEIFNLGFGKSYSIQEIIRIIMEITGQRAEVFFHNNCRPNEVLDLVADINKAKQLLNWTPKYDLLSGLCDLLAKK